MRPIAGPILGSLLGSLCLLGGSTRAHAQDADPVATLPSDYSIAYSRRPLNMPAGMVRLDGRFQVAHAGTGATETTIPQVAAGLAVGLTDNFELGITHARVGGWELQSAGAFVYDLGDDAGDPAFGDVSIYSRLAILQSEDFDLSGEIAVQLPLRDLSLWEFQFGLPARARLADRFVLDLAPAVVLGFGEDPVTDDFETHFAIQIPVAGVLQLQRHLWLAGRSGMFWPDFDIEQFHIPLLLELGGSIGGSKPVLDVALQGGMPRLFVPGGADTVQTDVWLLRLNLTGYLAF